LYILILNSLKFVFNYGDSKFTPMCLLFKFSPFVGGYKINTGFRDFTLIKFKISNKVCKIIGEKNKNPTLSHTKRKM
jgi:hypothetical protein